MLVGASEDVIAGGMQDLVLTIGWKGVSCAITIPLYPEMVTKGKGWGGGYEQS